ncbi:MAG TPA: ABC transporter permease, partial [Chryseolinea sp.]|nr:ABC transporter permease [Chryseolinea sp.]
MNNPNPVHPPKWPVRFLRFFVKKEYLEEIEGDMEELFQDHVEQFSFRKARRMYTWEILKLFRPILMRNLAFMSNLTYQGMFKNYFKVSLRGLLKNPTNSFINIFGLAAAIGICVFAYAFARWTYSTDQFHELKNEVFLVTFFADREGTPQQYGTTPRPLGEMLKNDLAHVKKVCRVEDGNVVVKYEDNVFHERVRYTDPEFLEMFTFPLKWGTTASLKDVNSIILSEPLSIKYFGDQNPVGLTMLVKFDDKRSKAFKITGVAKEFPEALTIRFDFLINFDNLRTSGPDYDFHDWTAFVNATFIQIDDTANIRTVAGAMAKYKKLQHAAVKEEWAISSFAFEPLATLHQRSEDIHDDISRSSQTNYATINWLIGISLLLLALASFNYINIATATAAKRLKEIGVRKSIGATRGIVIFQFLSENVVITFFALIVGVILAMTIFIPGFEGLWDFNMDFRLSDPKLWIYLVVVLLFTSVASGLYPSIYISKFQVVGILKGTVRFGQKNPITKILLCVQLTLSCIFMVLTVMFTQNTNYLAKRSWGYNPHDAMYTLLPDRASFDKLAALMEQDPDVLKVSGSVQHVGKKNLVTVLDFGDREYEVDELAVDANYFETMQLQLLQGRTFEDHEGSDRQSVVINELMAKNIGWTQPVGQVFRIDSSQFEVIGVVKDFHNHSFVTPMRSTMFRVANKDNYRYLSLRAKEGTELETYKQLQASWARLFPETPFDGGYQEDIWGGYFETIKIYSLVWRTFSCMAIILAGLGLYGLLTLNVAGRTKEFSIRKVLGAGLKNLAANISNQYMVLFGISLAIGAPLGYIGAKL